jgi:hypothetical protein
VDYEVGHIFPAMAFFKEAKSPRADLRFRP